MEEAGKALRTGAQDKTIRSAAGRALGSIVTLRKQEHARQIGEALRGRKLTEEQKERQRAGRAEYDARRKREAEQRKAQREAEAAAAKTAKRAAKEAAKAAIPPRRRGRPPKVATSQTDLPLEQTVDG